MPSTALYKRDWEKDHVYLFQFPRAGSIPSPSPYAFKLETWLRVNDIPYTNVSNEFKKFSAKGQIPFIEVNGRQFADSNLIIEHLITEYHKEDLDARLVPVDRAVARAFFNLFEHHLNWVTVYSRSVDNAWFATEKGFGGHVSGVKAFVFKKFLLGRFKGKLASATNAQGVGKLTPEEVIADAKKDIDAVSLQLGNKKYLFGDQIATIDTVAFGSLAQFLYAPFFTEELKKYIEEKAPNVANYVNRIKDQYWPDWDEAVTSLSLDTKWKQ